VDLKAFMADCEANYVRLHKLFPAIAEQETKSLTLGNGSLIIRVLERAPYTTLVSFCQSGSKQQGWLRLPAFKIRLYHDARLAEVVSCDTQHRVKPRNPYPNDNMHHPDEKAQWNRFLAEWLGQCLQHGYMQEFNHDFVDG
jgi:uncharacterized protein YqiB (DUF1249 family)